MSERGRSRTVFVASLALFTGLGAGWFLGRATGRVPGGDGATRAAPRSYVGPASYRDLGPRLLEAGILSLPRLEGAFERAATVLTPTQRRILLEGGDDPIRIDDANGLFLLDFFWAVGLANRNRILTHGPMAQRSGGRIDRYASTGGWRLGARAVTEVYASTELVRLTEAQQGRLERVAARVYRPCCDNPTAFPDCNHGMAMLGLLTVLAGEDASEAEMFAAAKYANAVWFPEQTAGLSAFLASVEGLDFRHAEAEKVVGPELASRTGYQSVRARLASAGPRDGSRGTAVSAC